MQTPHIASGLVLTLLSAFMGFSHPLPAHAEYGFLELAGGWKCEGQFQGSNGRGICVPREGVEPGNPYKYYRGDIRDGTFTGVGTFVYENDDRYEGQVRNGRPNGKGMFLVAGENQRYEGSFRNGEYHGQGVYTFADGSRYTGQFAGGQPHGKGTFVFLENGKYSHTYTGRFYLGVINGNGVVTNANGVRCSGVFYSSTLTGKGSCTYPRGNAFKTYSGELRNGRPDGRGSLVYSNGKRYTGEFRNGLPGFSADQGS
ncbi:MAG: hypothetical protein HC866_26895 [Leptolyngbyaceae cyanobacterium RU_5_1]|nr:hypothetical protein [Leptolyngbyaceae cyanobacterium RU_5_1]